MALHGFDLDLSYITRRIIAMGFPTEGGMEQQYRNAMTNVKRFFAEMHAGHYKVYNLCIERVYSQPAFELESQSKCSSSRY